MNTNAQRSESAAERANQRLDSIKSNNDMPEGFTIGYIGNLSIDGRTDNRSWSVFRAHPGRVGTSADRMGAFPTSERHKLLPIIAAIKFGRGE